MTIRIQGSDRNGWDTEDCETMADVRAYLSRPHIGTIRVRTERGLFILPKRMGERMTDEEAHMMDIMYGGE